MVAAASAGGNGRTIVRVSWVNREGRPCINATPETWCFCGHRFKVHDEAAGYRCRTAGCPCAQYSVHVAQGAWQVRCRCKHKHTDHDPADPRRRCRKLVGAKPCPCSGFDSPYVCVCDRPWAEHATVAREVAAELPALDGGAEPSAADALPPAHTAALTLDDVQRGAGAWASRERQALTLTTLSPNPNLAAAAAAPSADGGGGGEGGAQATARPPAGALASLKRRGGGGAGAQRGGAPAQPPNRAAPPPAGGRRSSRPESAGEAGGSVALVVGGGVLAQFSGNGEWYAARVLRVLGGSGAEARVRVRFEDDGVEETVGAHQLRTLHR